MLVSFFFLVYKNGYKLITSSLKTHEYIAAKLSPCIFSSLKCSSKAFSTIFPMKHLFFVLLLLANNYGSPLAAQEQLIEYSFNFESAESQLPKDAQESIQKIAQTALSWPQYHIFIQGHTDNVGDSNYNIELARSRALEVKKRLNIAGLSNENIRINALGEEQPIASNLYHEGRRQNRRVEIILSPSSTLNYQAPEQKRRAFLQSLKLPAAQFTLKNCQKEQYIQTEQGTQIHIPKDAFDVPEGTVVQLHIIEAYKKSDMILHNLNTMSNGKRLVSGGMLKIEAHTADKIPVHLQPNKTLSVNVPSQSPNSNMQLFYADTSAAAINWVNPEPLIVRTTPVSVASSLYDYLPTQYDSRTYNKFGRLSSRQISAKRSLPYKNKGASKPKDESLDLEHPALVQQPDSNQLLHWQKQLEKEQEKQQQPCTSFACKLKAFFTSKKRKAAIKEAEQTKLAELQKNVEHETTKLAESIKKYAAYLKDMKRYRTALKAAQQIYAAKIEAWKSTFPAIDSINFERACINKDLGFIDVHFSNRATEAYQRIYDVNSYQEAAAIKRNKNLKSYASYYLPKEWKMDDKALDSFITTYNSISTINTQFFRFAIEKRDSNYFQWRKSRTSAVAALLTMYQAKSLEEVRIKQLKERMDARRKAYEQKMDFYGVSTPEEAYEAEQRQWAQKRTWDQQLGYVFQTANLGSWINCDYFPSKTDAPLITQRFELPLSPRLATTYLIFKDIASLMSGSADYSGLNNYYNFSNIPEHKAVQVFSFYIDSQGQAQVALKSLQAQGSAIEKLDYQAMSLEEFKNTLMQLDT